MKTFTPFLFVLLTLASPLFAQTPLEKVAAACKIFPTYEAGVNNGAIDPMEYAVLQMKPGSEEMLEAEKMLPALRLLVDVVTRRTGPEHVGIVFPGPVDEGIIQAQPEASLPADFLHKRSKDVPSGGR